MILNKDLYTYSDTDILAELLKFFSQLFDSCEQYRIHFQLCDFTFVRIENNSNNKNRQRRVKIKITKEIHEKLMLRKTAKV